MPIIVRAKDRRDLDCGEHQLRPFLPAGAESEQLNYGQGEGQIRIGRSVWGVYSVEPYYRLVLEEGELTPREFEQSLDAIRAALATHFACEIEVLHFGDLNGDSGAYIIPPYR